MDVEIYERTMRHLEKAVLRELSQELKEYSNEELRGVIEQQQRLQSLESDIEDDIVNSKKELKTVQEEISKYERRQTEKEICI